MTGSWLKEHLLGSTIIAGVTAAFVFGAPPVVLAQDVDDEDILEQAEEEEEEDERVVVTGSRIARDTFSSISPLQVIDGETRREAGIIGVGQILQLSNAAQGTQIDTSFSGFVLDEGPGATTIGLRGLEASRTLTLLNGRRLAPSGVEGAPSAPDLNLIPNTIVERFDILLDGASSVYGSDAVAGVINVILRKDFDGLELNFYRDFTENGGGEQDTYSATWGLSNDRGFIGFAGEYYEQRALKFTNIEGGQCNRHIEQTRNGDIRNREIDILQTFPGTTSTNCQREGINSQFRIFSPQTQLFATPGRTNVGIPGFSTLEDADGDGIIDVDLADPQYNNWIFDEDSDFISPLRQFSAFSYGEYDIGVNFDGVLENNVAFFEAFYANRQNTIRSGQAQVFPGVPIDNPFNPCNTGSVDGVVQNPDAVDCVAALGLAGQFASTPIFFVDNDRRNTKVEVQQVRLVAGFKGDAPIFNEIPFLRDWTYEISGSYTRSTGLSTREGIREDRLALSLGTSVRLADGSVVCGTDFNGDGFPDSVSSFPDAFGFLDDGVGCVPINPYAALVTDDLTPEERAYVFGTRRVNTIIEQSIVNGFLTGVLYDLPAGPMSGVVGFEYRDDEINTDPNDVARDGLLAGFFEDRGANGSRSLAEVFFEVEVPVLKDLPFAEELTVTGSGRYTEEENFGAAWTYSAKGVYQPVDFFTIRGTYGTSYRAPNLREAFFAGSTSFAAGGNDPCVVPFGALDADGNYDPTLDDRSQNLLDNCLLDGVDPTALGIGGVPSVQVLAGGNDDLVEETSTAWSAGFVVEQPLFDSFQLQFSMTYSEIEVLNTVEEPGLGDIFSLCYNSNNLSSAFCDRVERLGVDPAFNFTSLVDASFINVGVQTSKNIDYNLFYAQEFDLFERPLEISLDLRATNNLSQFEQLIGDDQDNNVGEQGFPRLRFNGTFLANYVTDVGDFRVQWFTRFISAQQNDTGDPFGAQDTCLGTDAGDTDCRDVFFLDNYWVHNVSLSYDYETWNATFGVRNVFDTLAPRADSSEITVSRHGNFPLGVGYDPFGRTYFASIGKRF